MENQENKSLFAIAVPYAVIIAIVTSIVTLVSYVTGFSFFFGGAIANLLKALAFLVTFIIVGFHWKKKYDVITYKDAFVFGLIVIGSYVAIMFVLDFCFFQFIAPDFYNELRDHTLQFMIDWKVPEDQIADAEKRFAEGQAGATPLGMSIQMAVMRTIADVIILSIVAIFLRKQPPVYMQNLNNPPLA